MRPGKERSFDSLTKEEIVSFIRGYETSRRDEDSRELKPETSLGSVGAVGAPGYATVNESPNFMFTAVVDTSRVHEKTKASVFFKHSRFAQQRATGASLSAPSLGNTLLALNAPSSRSLEHMESSRSLLSEQDERKASDDEYRRSRRWEKRFRQLERYREQHGNCNVPLVFVDSGDAADRELRALGTWAYNQRHEYQRRKRRERRHLKKESSSQSLDGQGKPGAASASTSVACETDSASCGSSSVPPLKAGSKSILTEERIERLNNIGFIWNLSKS